MNQEAFDSSRAAVSSEGQLGEVAGGLGLRMTTLPQQQTGEVTPPKHELESLSSFRGVAAGGASRSPPTAFKPRCFIHELPIVPVGSRLGRRKSVNNRASPKTR